MKTIGNTASNPSKADRASGRKTAKVARKRRSSFEQVMQLLEEQSTPIDIRKRRLQIEEEERDCLRTMAQAMAMEAQCSKEAEERAAKQSRVDSILKVINCGSVSQELKSTLELELITLLQHA